MKEFLYASATLASPAEMLETIQYANVKQDARDEVLAGIGPKPDADAEPLRICTFPGPVPHFELQLYAHLEGRVQLTGIERDTRIFKLLTDNAQAANLAIDLINMEDTVYWASAMAKSFDAIWLDYNGHFSPHLLKTMRNICGRGFLNFREDRNPVIFVTLAEGQERPHIFDPLIATAVRALKWRRSVKIKARAERITPKAWISKYASAGWDPTKTLSHELIIRMTGKMAPGDLAANRLARVAGFASEMNKVVRKHGFSIIPHRVLRYYDYARNAHARHMLLFPLEICRGQRQFDFWNNMEVRNISHSSDSMPHS